MSTSCSGELINTYKIAQNGNYSVRKAAALHDVTETSQQDRFLSNVHTDTVSAGTYPLFNLAEKNIVQ